MGCSSHIDTSEKIIPNQVNQVIKEQNTQQKNIEQNKIPSKTLEINQKLKNKEPVKSLTKKEEKINENETNEEILYLEYETTSDNEEILLLGNEVDEFDDYTPPFYEREHTKFDLYYNDNKIDIFYYTFEKAGTHLIKMVLKGKISNFTYMFYNCTNLKSIKGYIDTSNIRSFSWLFNNCSSLVDISALKRWNITNVRTFDFMFNKCSSLTDLSPISQWDMSGDRSIGSMFSGCESLTDLKPLQNWDISGCDTLNFLFSKCSSLSDLSPLKNWNLSNARNFLHMFSECDSLTDITPLKNWDVSSGEYFRDMFYKCTNLTTISGIKDWNISNAKQLGGMFDKCGKIKDADSLIDKFGNDILEPPKSFW